LGEIRNHKTEIPTVNATVDFSVESSQKAVCNLKNESKRSGLYFKKNSNKNI